MKIAKNIYSNTDKFIVGNSIRFFYVGKLYDFTDENPIYFCYSQNKPKKNQEEDIVKIEMNKSDFNAQTEISVNQLGTMYFFIEVNGKRDNNRGHYYKINVEEMPLALAVLKQQALPQKISRLDFFKDQIKTTLTRAFDTISKLTSLNTYSKEKELKDVYGKRN